MFSMLGGRYYSTMPDASALDNCAELPSLMEIQHPKHLI